MSEIRPVRIPQLGVNDQEAKIVAWLVDDGGYCEKGNAICAIETTKVAIEIPADRSGIVLHLAAVGDELEIGQVIGLIGDNVEVLRAEQEKYKKKESSVGKATDKAKALAESLGIDLGQIQTAGIIREADVLSFHGLADNTPIAKVPSGLVIYGAGRGGINAFETTGMYGNNFMDGLASCFVDDGGTHTELCGVPVYHSSRLSELFDAGYNRIFIAIANGHKRVELSEQLRATGWRIENIVHRGAFLAPSVYMGYGNHIKAGAVIDSNTVIGNCCIVDNNVAIPHDVTIGNGVHIAPGATLGSSITVGDYAIIGIGASIATGVKVGRRAIIGVGCGVTNDVGDGDYVEGVPAHIVSTSSKKKGA